MRKTFSKNVNNIYADENYYEKALLVFIKFKKPGLREPKDLKENVLELKNLVSSAGGKTEAVVVHSQNEPNPKYYISTGKLEEIKSLIEEKDIGLIVMDDEISPTQQRNLQNKLNAKIIDRTALILDIFAQRAHSKDGKLQVELAQLNYLLPRLTGKGIELSKLGGGIGTRGPGETKLEVDRRTIRGRISQLKKKINRMAVQRDTQRKKREKNKIPQVSLVGYTNSGKSTLLNTLTDSSVETKNRLFSTLDSTVRKLKTDLGYEILLSDTVGFIEKLPHQLIASFKSTLEEVRKSDLLLMVVDISNKNFENHIESVISVLKEIGVGEKPILMAFNKIDKVNESIINRVRFKYKNAIFISALKGIGLDKLLEKVKQTLQENYISLTLKIPYSENKLISLLFENYQVLKRKYLKDSVLLTLNADHQIYSRFSKYIYKGAISNY